MINNDMPSTLPRIMYASVIIMLMPPDYFFVFRDSPMKGDVNAFFLKKIVHQREGNV